MLYPLSIRPINIHIQSIITGKKRLLINNELKNNPIVDEKTTSANILAFLLYK